MTGGGAEPTGFCPLRADSCAAARVRLARFDWGAPVRGAIGAGAVAFAIAGTAPGERVRRHGLITREASSQNAFALQIDLGHESWSSEAAE